MPTNQNSLLDRFTTKTIDGALWLSILGVGRNLNEIFVSHDARMHISGDHAIQHLIESHKRSKLLSNALLFFGGLSGTVAYYKTKDVYWLVGSGFLFAGIPYCTFIENPIADELKFYTLDAKSEKARLLLNSWGHVQIGKLALVLGGALVYYWFAQH